MFREMKAVVKLEVLPSKEELENIEFDLKDDESDSTEEQESEEEYPHTPVLRRSVQERRIPEKKLNAKGKVEKYKVQLVEKGYSEVEGINFGEIFSPVAKLTSIRFLLSVAAAFDFEVE
jgi:hypothetical protein